MNLYLISLSALLLCGCGNDAPTQENWTTYNPPSGELPADPRATNSTQSSGLVVAEAPAGARLDRREESEPLSDKLTVPFSPDDAQFLSTPSSGVEIAGASAGEMLDRPEEVAPLPDTPVVPFSPADLQFIQHAAHGGLFQVRASQLALEKSTSEPHTRFAQRMLDEHEVWNKELADLVRIKGGEVPTTLDSAHQRKLDDLALVEAPQFDGAFCDAETEEHDAAIRNFEAAARTVDDPELLAFVQRVLPTLREHRRELDDLRQGP